MGPPQKVFKKSISGGKIIEINMCDALYAKSTKTAGSIANRNTQDNACEPAYEPTDDVPLH